VPAYRGAAPVQHQVLRGEQKTGCSLIQSVKGMDAGPVLIQKKIDLRSNETASELLTKLMALGVDLFVNNFSSWWSGHLKPLPQAGEVSWAPKLTRKDLNLNPESQTGIDLHNQIRGLTLNQFARLSIDLKGELVEIRIKSSQICSQSPSSASSKRHNLLISKKGFFLQGCDGVLVEILSLGLPNGKTLSGRDFVNGYGNFLN
jgi:methionyl-tRNA formyltransferase